MKILLAGIGYRGYTETYERALASMGHQVVTYVGLRQFDWETRLRRLLTVRLPRIVGVRRDYLWSEQSRFRAYLRQGSERFDLALFVNSDRLANDDILDELRRRASATGVWLLDDFDTIPRHGLDFSSFDHCATFNPVEARTLPLRTGVAFDFVPQGFAPIATDPAAASTRPLILGAPYPSRRAALHALVAAGVPVETVGNLWPKWVTPSDRIVCSGDVSLSRSVAISSDARLCVNGHRSPDTGVSPRVFEIGGAGGVIVTDGAHVPDFYEPGAEMIHWIEVDDLVAQLLPLLRDSARARTIAERAHRRTLAEHRIVHRFSLLFEGWGYA